MPKEKPFLVNIPAFYKKPIEDIFMLGYVLGLKRGLPAVSDKQAILLWIEEMGLTEDDYSITVAQNIYIEAKKTYLKINKMETSIAERRINLINSLEEAKKIISETIK